MFILTAVFALMQMMIHLLDSLPTGTFVVARMKTARPTPYANNCTRRWYAYGGTMTKSETKRPIASHLLDFDRSYLSLHDNVNRAEIRSIVKEFTTVRLPPYSPQSDATSLSRERGQGERERENDEGRESARGMDAAWTENGVILPACS